jgi:competence protein ComEC
MRISALGMSLLLPGDVSRSVEKQLLASGEPLGSPVLKVARHGSKSSSSLEFLARVAPRVAIVTAESGGFGNLPNPEVLEALRNAGARVVRMDTAGATTVQWTGGSLLVRTYRTGDMVVPAGSVTFKVR